MLDTEKIIAKVDDLTPNQYSKEQKINWLDQLESKIDIELRQTHIVPDDDLLDNPYENDLYVYWLQAQIALQNAEIAKYNQQITLFNTYYDEYGAFINRKYFPKQPVSGNRFHF